MWNLSTQWNIFLRYYFTNNLNGRTFQRYHFHVASRKCNFPYFRFLLNATSISNSAVLYVSRLKLGRARWFNFSRRRLLIESVIERNIKRIYVAWHIFPVFVTKLVLYSAIELVVIMEYNVNYALDNVIKGIIIHNGSMKKVETLCGF